MMISRNGSEERMEEPVAAVARLIVKQTTVNLLCHEMLNLL